MSLRNKRNKPKVEIVDTQSELGITCAAVTTCDVFLSFLLVSRL